jgi:hypothetical protein
MFNGTTQLGDVPPASVILEFDGMDKKHAEQLAIAAFRITMASIDVFIPDINYRKDGYRFTICDDGDLHVAPPYLDE